MKIYNSIGSKDRFLEMYQRVNKIQLNEDMTQEADLAGNAFNALVNNELKIQQTNSQLENGIGFVEIIGLDKAGNSVTFRFEATSKQGDQEGVYGVDSAKLIEFKIKTHSFDADLPEESNTIRKLNAERGSEMIDIVSKLADFSEEAPEVDEVYEDAIKLIDRVPYKNGTENMVQHKQYADNKPTNPEVRVDATELQKFVSEVQEFNPDEDNAFKLPPDISNPELYDEPAEPEDNEPAEPLTPEEEELNLQAYENLMARNKTSRNPNYSPTMPEIMAEIDRLKNPNALPKPKTRVLPKEAEPWLEEEIRTTASSPDAVAQKSLSPEKKREYIEKAKNFLETSLGAEAFYNLQKKERNILIAQFANKILTTELTYGNFGVSMNETDYPKELGIGKEFKTKTNFPKPKKVHKTKKTLIKTGIDEDLNSLLSYSQSARDSGILFPRAKELGVTNQYILKDALKDAGIELLDIQPSETPRVFWLIFSVDGKKYRGLINQNYGNAAKVVRGIQMRLEKGMMPMQEEEKPENDGMSLEPKGDEVAQLAQDKEETGEILKGGKGDDKSPLEFDADQIMKGLEVEKEHTDDPMIAIEIVLDHLTEDPEYYTVKDNPEASAQAGAANDAAGDAEESENDDKEMTDTLLGYKSKNVGDEMSEDIVGAAGAQPAVGTDVSTETPESKKFREYQKRDIHSLSDEEKKEYFNLFKNFIAMDYE